MTRKKRKTKVVVLSSRGTLQTFQFHDQGAQQMAHIAAAAAASRWARLLSIRVSIVER
jgi:hypothetical protein